MHISSKSAVRGFFDLTCNRCCRPTSPKNSVFRPKYALKCIICTIKSNHKYPNDPKILCQMGRNHYSLKYIRIRPKNRLFWLNKTFKTGLCTNTLRTGPLTSGVQGKICQYWVFFAQTVVFKDLYSDFH